MLNYEKLIQAAAASVLLEQDAGKASTKLEGVIEGLRLTQGADGICGRRIEQVSADIHALIMEKLPPITAEDIRTIMEGYGESLGDRGADYEEEFLVWFQEREPKIYQAWRQKEDKWAAQRKKQFPPPVTESAEDRKFFDKMKDSPAQELLFAYSNNSLGDRLTEEQHDRLLAEFAQVNLRARRHLLRLKEDLKRDEEEDI